VDEGLIGDWFDAYSDDVYRFLVYYTARTDVEDLLQDVFIRAIDGYDSFKGEASPKTWLISIARNIAIDEARKRKRKDWRKLIGLYETRSEISPEERHLSNEQQVILHRAITQLKRDYRDVVIFRGIEELSVAETAAVLNWSESKVRVTFHRALKTLKSRLKGVYHDEE